MKIRGVELTYYPQVGLWGCQVWFRLTTVRQFTDEECQAEADARWWWLALWRGWRAAKRYANANAAKPGERTAMGWAE